MPGGNANVFTRALGLPADPIDATGQILAGHSAPEHAHHRARRWPDDRYFTCSAGLGLDAEVVRAIEGLRATGRPVSMALYVDRDPAVSTPPPTGGTRADPGA